jgi:hypothetical protein
VKLGGEGWTVESFDDRFVWNAPATEAPVFVVEFGADPPASAAGAHIASGFEVRPHRKADLATRSPKLNIAGEDEIADFFQSVPGLVESCKVRDLGMTRATPGAYYWIWSWDNMVTGLEMLRWGDTTGVAKMLAFINAHRDDGGAIPGRWTRSLQPLDTPSPGALEALFAILLSRYVAETGNRQPLLEAYPYLVLHLQRMRALVNEQGLFPNIGFYPDLPLKYGRTEQSAVALEVGCFYVFCRMLEDAAHELADKATAAEAGLLAARVGEGFLATFWDEERGFLLDSLHLTTGERNRSYPLFTLLFLQSAAGFSLLGDRMASMGEFMYANHLGTVGTSLVPHWDLRHGTEDALASWYPHWDVYMLKVFRRTGHVDGIMRWFSNVRSMLRNLGYIPEFLTLSDSPERDSMDWGRHGAYANLNCVTGCYHGLIEGVVGVDFGKEGMTLIPLSLPLGKITLDGVVYRNTRWTVEIENDGPELDRVLIDGVPIEGTLTVPGCYHDGARHRLQMCYH